MLGLAAYIFTNSMQRSWRVSEALEYGLVGVNEGLISTEVDNSLHMEWIDILNVHSIYIYYLNLIIIGGSIWGCETIRSWA